MGGGSQDSGGIVGSGGHYTPLPFPQIVVGGIVEGSGHILAV